MLLSLAALLGLQGSLAAQQLDVTSPNAPDEPLGEFSVERAVRFMDATSLAWQKERRCFACHTNYLYLVAKPMLGVDQAHQQVREFAEQMVAGWAATPPRRYYEAPGHAAFLAINDALTTGQLHPATLAALQLMWSYQRLDGSFRFPDCDWPPMESDQHFGNSLLALAIGMAPQNYAQSPEIAAALQRLRQWLAANPPSLLHQRAMILWASLHLDGLAGEVDRAQTVAALRAVQNDDGGWAMTRLGDWRRGDGTPQSYDSDGYGTGFVIFILRQAGVPADDGQIQRGIVWLKANQRVSGRWFTRSGFKDSRHLITHAGTAMALMALAACGEIPRSP